MTTRAMLLSAVAAAVAASTGVEAAEIQVNADLIRTNFPEIAAELSADGTAAGAKAERDRVLAIQAAAFPGQEQLAGELIADGKTTAGEAALRFNAEQKGKLKTSAAAIVNNDKVVAEVRPAPSAIGAGEGGPGAGLEGEQKHKAEWAADKKLAEEFRSEAAYCAYRKMEDAGQVKIFGQKSRAA
jgi:hypothetical protein